MKNPFTHKHKTFDDWFTVTPPTPYRDRIARLHILYPEATLSQVRGHPRPGEAHLNELIPMEPWKRTWSQLSPRERYTRRRALKVLSLMRRKGLSLTKACRKVGILPRTVYASTNAVVKEGARWRAKDWDAIEREMAINERGLSKYIPVKDSRHASTVGRYHCAVKEFLHTGDESHLRPFRGKRVRDVHAVRHYLETDPAILYEIEERREDQEFYTIYKDG